MGILTQWCARERDRALLIAARRLCATKCWPPIGPSYEQGEGYTDNVHAHNEHRRDAWVANGCMPRRYWDEEAEIRGARPPKRPRWYY